MAEVKNIIIYTTPSCPFSGQLKAFLFKHGFKYRSHDVTADPGASSEMVAKSGQLGVPVIDIDGRIVVGFQKGQICSLLGIEEVDGD